MRHRALAVAFLIVATAAEPLHAQLPFVPHIVCGGVESDCFGLGWIWNAGGTASLSLFVQNLQGSDPRAFGGGNPAPGFPTGLNAIGFYRVNDPNYVPGGPVDIDYSPVLGTSFLGGSGVGAIQLQDQPIFMSQDLNNASGSVTQYTYTFQLFGLIGCTSNENTFLGFDAVARTCPHSGLDGWLRLDFAIGLSDGGAPPLMPISESDVDIDLFGICHVGSSSTCNVLPYRITATPEPASVALMVTGLMSVGAGVRRRRGVAR